MPFTVTMPKLSPTMETGTIVKWHKQVGNFVNAGELLLEIATDKANMEHTALDAGWLRYILVSEGSEALINAPLALFTETEEEDFQVYLASLKQTERTSSPISDESEQQRSVEEKLQELEFPKNAEKFFAQPQFAPEPPLVNYHFEWPLEKLEERILASPLARKIAKDNHLDLSALKGTGPNERIVKEDLKKAPKKGVLGFSRREKPRYLPGTYEEISLTPMRKAIARRLQEAKTFIPHFYVTSIIRAEGLVHAREQFKNGDIKLSVNDFVMRAVAIALQMHPDVNSGFHSLNQTIVRFQTIDLAIAVSVKGGLITPIIRHANLKNLNELSTEIRLLAENARQGKLQPEEYKGGSFTISNLGMYGVSEFQAILNPPQAAILAVGAIQDAPVVEHDKVIPGKTMHLTLSVDHRVIDGAVAAIFLQTLKKLLENPILLTLN